MLDRPAGRCIFVSVPISLLKFDHRHIRPCWAILGRALAPGIGTASRGVFWVSWMRVLKSAAPPATKLNDWGVVAKDRDCRLAYVTIVRAFDHESAIEKAFDQFADRGIFFLTQPIARNLGPNHRRPNAHDSQTVDLFRSDIVTTHAIWIGTLPIRAKLAC